MQDILEQYLSKSIGINLERAFHLQKVTLMQAEKEYFTVASDHDDCLHYFPYSAILQVVENPNGVRVGGLFQHKETYSLVVKVGHMAEYIPV